MLFCVPWHPWSSIITIHTLPGDQCAVPCTWTWIHPDSSSRAVALMGDVPKNMELSCDINGIFTKHGQKYKCLPKKGNSRAGYETKTLWLSTGEKQTERRLELQSPSWWDLTQNLLSVVVHERNHVISMQHRHDSLDRYSSSNNHTKWFLNDACTSILSTQVDNTIG